MVDKVCADNWDLTAVVRSCSSVTNTTNHPQKFKTTTTNTAVETSSGAASENPLSFLSTLKFEEEEDPFFFPDLLMETDNGFDELQDSFKQFLNYDNPSSLTSLQEQQHQQWQQPPPPLTTMTTTAAVAAPATSTTSSSIFVFGDPEIENQHHSTVHQQQPQPQPHQQQQVAPDHSCLHPLRQLQSRSRKRKTPPKRMVCQVTEENLSTDLWAWRKYGQKPIKGSPYPRNYYRCSSSKGCAARKQVDRSTTDPNIFVISYTGEHTHPRPTHRNSLAGISRNKFPRAQDPVADVASPTHLSVTMPAEVALPPTLAEEKKPGAGDFHEGAGDAGAADGEDDEEDLLIPNLSAAMHEDPFSGLDRFHAHNPAFSGGGSGGTRVLYI